MKYFADETIVCALQASPGVLQSDPILAMLISLKDLTDNSSSLGTTASTLEFAAWLCAAAEEREEGAHRGEFGNWRIRNRRR